ncbi:MAG TPA: LLM class flavin-dependent oxidoreductase, partial [Phototrophicaceae bacterium]|nr:LLM class flavin-dependent oxidoreductase [Phototrophicaceae bacterium]
MPAQFGLNIPATQPREKMNTWLDEFDTGLKHLGSHVSNLWMTDHFFWEEEPTWEAWTIMSYFAAKYPDLKIGSIVLGQSYRNPAMIAKMAATLQTLTKGNLIFGIGAGWKEDEYRAYDYPYPTPGVRLEQLEDTLEIVKRLWTEPGKVTYHGKHYSVIDAYCEPKPNPIPRILVGGGGNKTMMLAARFADEWNIPDANFAKYNDRLTVVRQHCETIGRDPATLAISWFGRLGVAKTEAEAVAYSQGKWTSQNGFVGTPQQIIDQLAPFLEVGVSLFMFDILGFPRED